MTDPRIEELRNLLPRAMLPDWVRLGSRLVRVLRDSHHPDKRGAILDRLLQQAQASAQLREMRTALRPAVSYPHELPITSRKDEIVAAIREHQVVVVAGETGSGKTTQLPKMCLEAGLGLEAKIGCTQPRRVAALSISRRVAEELNVTWGREVGCKIRFDDRSSPETYIKFMTDGILLAETQGDRLLSEYNALIIDEAHERSLNIDFLLGYLKGLLAKRRELKLVITSATIDTHAFSQAFDDAPIIEVSGRLYPVEVAYAPFDAASEENGDMTYIDAAVRATEQVLMEPGRGDVLVFMPGERDIRETTDLLKGRLGDKAEIIPLFGRLSAGEQQRVFAPSDQTKIVVATNIAETSLTIPGIRYVIDTGLARISRYNPRTRTRRLPIEPVAQSSANQRKGRSGRVQNGVCIRLYPEADFLDRPAYAQPEIQRANLAEVILRMKTFRLGEIETFPFINPPTPGAIDGGYKLLQELGALDAARELTPLGRDLGRLPIDPTLGRMLLQAEREHATRELLIIAAALSIQDPRERPFEQKETANAAHRRFVHPKSDFLALLNIWSAVHEQWERLPTQNQRRKFCKVNFLSYLRMREWQDLHAQLEDVLQELGIPLDESTASYEAIHRSILAGLLGHVAMRAERNTYKGAGNRELTLFPGSGLYERTQPKPRNPRQPLPAKAGTPSQSSQPEWVMAGEIVETSQLFLRTVAEIDPAWIVQLAPHLCRVTHHNPHWSPEAGRVLAEEKTTLYGLEVQHRKVAYGNINPREATAIFIRSALVEDNLFPEPPEKGSRVHVRGKIRGPGVDRPRLRLEDELALAEAQSVGERGARAGAECYPFLENNRKVRQKIETWQTRSRRHDLADMDEALFQFYSQRMENVSSIHELNRFVAEGGGDRLCVNEADLVGPEALTYDAAAFPDSVPLAGQQVALAYAYSPGDEHDGVTVRLDAELAGAVSPASIEWAVPGLREAQVTEWLRSLPKGVRKQLMPLAPKAAEIARELKPGERTLKEDLARFIRQRYGVEVPGGSWAAEAVPLHLRPRIEVLGAHQQVLGASRDLGQLRDALERAKLQAATEAAEQGPRERADSPDPRRALWAKAAEKWERFGLRGWTFGDLPERVPVAADDPEPLWAWPALELESGQVHLRLFRTPEAARKSSAPALLRLVEMALERELAWLRKDLQGLNKFAPLTAGWVSADELQESAYVHLKKHVLTPVPPMLTREAEFLSAVEQARSRLPALAVTFMDRLEPLLKLRQEIVRRFVQVPAVQPAARRLTDLSQLGAAAPAQKPGLAAAELEQLMPADFLSRLSFERLPHLARYLKALLVRAERASMNPLKDQERSRQLAPFVEALRKLQGNPPDTEAGRQLMEEFRWMVEEFRVSLFAQELGTAVPVSAKRLEQHLARIAAA